MLQAIYRYAYEFLGKLLYLSHEFPPPKDVFSGAVFSAFYIVNAQPSKFLNPLNCVTGFTHYIFCGQH